MDPMICTNYLLLCIGVRRLFTDWSHSRGYRSTILVHLQEDYKDMRFTESVAEGGGKGIHT